MEKKEKKIIWRLTITKMVDDMNLEACQKKKKRHELGREI